MSDHSLLVFGAGGHGKVVCDAARSAGFQVRAFVDDNADRRQPSTLGLPLLSWQQLLADCGAYAGTSIALGIGDNGARQRCHERIESLGWTVVTVVHKSAVLAPSAIVGPGAVVMALAAVNPDAAIGEGAILNTGCVVEHDCVLGRYVHLSPNCALGGGVRIGDRTHLGLGAVALPGVSIGSDVRVGAGAVVHRDVRDGATVVGVPARSMRSKGESNK